MRAGTEWMLVAALVAASAIALGPVLTHGFVSFDDGLYVLDNANVRAGLTWHGVRWAFSSREYASFYHPLTWLSHMLDVELYGVTGKFLGLPAAGWHHLTNLVLHVANALLLFAVLRAATRRVWRSYLVAALFALHPLHVESVAWVAERKDVLSTFFGFGCLLAYVWYAARPGLARYALVFGLLVCGLLAKPMLVTWPFVMLLLDWWPLGRVRPWGPGPAWTQTATPPTHASARGLRDRPAFLVLEKLPFFALVALFAALAYLAEQPTAMGLMQKLSLGTRLENAAVSVLRYVCKTLWPSNLAPHYPYRALPGGLVVAACACLAAGTFIALRSARRQPYLAVGWLWFLGTLVPVIGIVQVGLHSMADRYTYVPLVGLFAAVVWSLAELRLRFPQLRRALPAIAVVALVVNAAMTARQVRYWRDSVTLFEHASVVAPDSGWVHRILGTALAAESRHEEALREYQLALSRWPEDPIAHNNLARSLAEMGRAEAEHEYRQAIRFDPEDATYRTNLGTLLARRGDLEGSLEPLQEAIRLAPDHVQAHIHLGKSLALLGRMEDAALRFEMATRLEPDNVAAWNNLAAARAATGRFDAASHAAAEALRAAATNGSEDLVPVLRQRLQEYRQKAKSAAGPAAK